MWVGRRMKKNKMLLLSFSQLCGEADEMESGKTSVSVLGLHWAFTGPSLSHAVITLSYDDHQDQRLKHTGPVVYYISVGTF